MPVRPATKVVRSSLFLLLNLALVVLLLTTPGYVIRQSIDDDRRYNIITISVIYIATFIVVLIVYASRLYTNRTVLAGIPKKWIPIEKDDVGYKVWAMIQAGLLRSATIAYKAKPRLLDGTVHDELEMPISASGSGDDEAKSEHSIDEKGGPNDAKNSIKHPPWGLISHAGWSSPAEVDMPNVQYCTVIAELPNLIEARAVSLGMNLEDDDLLDLLSRRSHMSLRAYVSFLSSMGMLHMKASAVQRLLKVYEQARFSGTQLSETEFRALTTASAEVIQSMVGPSSSTSSIRSSYASSIKSSLTA